MHLFAKLILFRQARVDFSWVVLHSTLSFGKEEVVDKYDCATFHLVFWQERDQYLFVLSLIVRFA